MKHVHDRQQLAFACFVSCVEKGLSVRSEAAEFGFFVCLFNIARREHADPIAQIRLRRD